VGVLAETNSDRTRNYTRRHAMSTEVTKKPPVTARSARQERRQIRPTRARPLAGTRQGRRPRARRLAPRRRRNPAEKVRTSPPDNLEARKATPSRRRRRRTILSEAVNCQLSEYHQWAWRKHSSIHAGLANAEIRIGERWGQLGPLQLPPLSSKFKFDSWDSANKLVPIQRNYADGASATEIGATFRNGCLTCGKSR